MKTRKAKTHLAEPSSRSSGTGRGILHDVAAISLEDDLARAAAVRGRPVGEEVSVVRRNVGLGSDPHCESFGLDRQAREGEGGGTRTLGEVEASGRSRDRGGDRPLAQASVVDSGSADEGKEGTAEEEGRGEHFEDMVQTKEGARRETKQRSCG